MKIYKKVLVVIIVLIILIIVDIYREHPHVTEYDEKEFLKNVDACNKIAAIYYEDYQKNNTDLTLSYSPIESGTIHCYSYNYDIVLSDEDNEIYQNAIKTMREQMCNHIIYHVYVYDTFVSFCGGDKERTVIYSAEDKWPSYITYPGGDWRKKSKTIAKITDHWYKAYIEEGL